MNEQKGLIVLMLGLCLLSLSIASSVASGSQKRWQRNAFQSNALSAAVTFNRDPATQNKTVKLTIRVLEPGPKPVADAEVNITHDAFGPEFRAYDYHLTTNADGIATTDIVIGKKWGEGSLYWPVVDIEVTKDRMRGTGRVRFVGPNYRPEEECKILMHPTDSTGASLAVVKIKVVDEKGDGIDGARVFVSGSSANERGEATTGADGFAIVSVSVVLRKGYSIEVSKTGYENGRAGIELSDKQLGTLVAGPTIPLSKAAGVAVVVVVRDQDPPHNKIGDARVTLNGPQPYFGTTDSSGTAIIYVREIGAYSVSISQEDYEPFAGGEIRVRPGEPATAAFELIAKEKKAGRDTITVTVLKKEPGDENAKPLPGAMVSIGGIGITTNSEGKAILEGSYSITETVNVSAIGYKTQSNAVRLSREVLSSNSHGAATFILEPDVTVTPILLVVEVRSSADPDKRVEGASVLLRLSNGKIVGLQDTNSQGEASFELRDTAEAPLSQLRAGIRLDVAKEKYKIKYSDVTSELLQPSAQPRRVTVFLEHDWSDLRTAVDVLEQSVMAWNNDVIVRGQGTQLLEKLANEAPQAKQKADGLLREIEAAKPALNAGVNGITLAAARCKEAALLRANIQVYKSQADANEQAIKSLLESASPIINSCATTGDAEKIRAVSRSVTDMARTIASLEQKAAKDNADLVKLGRDQSDLKQTADVVTQKIAELEQLANKAQTDAGTAREYYARANNLSKTLFARHGALRGQLQTLKANYEVERYAKDLPADLTQRLGVMDKLLANGDGSVFGEPNPQWPNTVQEVAAQIQSDLGNAQKVMTVFAGDKSSSACDTTTMEDVVQEIDAAASAAQFSAASLNSKADACGKRAKTSDDKLKVEDIPDSLDPGKPKSSSNRANNKPVVEDIPDTLDPGKPKSSGNRANNKPVVEDIPSTLDPGSKTTLGRTDSNTGSSQSGNNPPAGPGNGSQNLWDRDLCTLVPNDVTVEKDFWTPTRGCKADARYGGDDAVHIKIYHHSSPEEARHYLNSGNFQSTSEFGDGGYMRNESGNFFVNFTRGPIFVEVIGWGTKAPRAEAIARQIDATLRQWMN